MEIGGDASRLSTSRVAPLLVEFTGERVEVRPGRVFAIGRSGDLVIDDNPYLHRRFLELADDGGMWWLANVGSRIAATVADASGLIHARLAPGARLAIAVDRLDVVFAAGSTNYDLTLLSEGGVPTATRLPARDELGEDTRGGVPLSPAQLLLVVALAENVLRSAAIGRGGIPSSAEAAARLGWTFTAFTRRLDTVCAKLEREGVTGLRGGRGNLATNRRLRLVEHAVATRLVTPSDLVLLDGL